MTRGGDVSQQGREAVTKYQHMDQDLLVRVSERRDAVHAPV